MSFKPFHDNVLIKQVTSETASSGGLYVPTQDAEGIQAQVVAVGPGKTLEDGTLGHMAAVVGQTVVVAQWAGPMIMLDGVQHLVIPEKHILGALG